MTLRLAVLASGHGSNLRAILAARDRGELPVEVVGVGSDRPGCAAVASARAARIPVFVHAAGDHRNRAEFDASLFADLARVHPDLIVCAGYMRLIDAEAVRGVQGRMINIHPSLLPAYPGLHTHARALADGVREHGASVHVVTPELDAGPVLAQARVPVELNDTPATLAARVLLREHPLLCAVIGCLARGELEIGPAAPPRWHGLALDRPLQLGADNHTLEIA
jgi:phosphoribosylglycinamide formyltransferase-1